MRIRKSLNRRVTLFIMICAVAVAAAVILSSPAYGKKRAGSSELRKVIAIGNVDMGQMGFSSMTPEAVSDLFRQKARAELEKTGRYAVILPSPAEGKSGGKKARDIKPPSSQAEIHTYMAEMMEMQKQMHRDSARMRGQYVHEPVAAQGLFNFAASRGRGGVDSGGIFSTAESFGAPSGIGAADFTTDSVRLTLTCMMLDPEDGRMLDQHRAQASSTKLTRAGGASYYTMEDTSNPDRAFDNMFKRSLARCIRWIDGKMRNQPWEGQVFKKSGRKLYVNAGSSAGIVEGMSFDAFRRETVAGKGVAFGAQDSKTGTLRITQVHEAYSVAEPVGGSADVGAVLRPSAN